MTSSSIVAKILHSFSDSVAFGINTFLPELISKPLTEGAFTIARYKIKWAYFQHLFRMVANEAAQCLPSQYWHGYKVLAADGTTVNIPKTEETKKHFGVTATNNDGRETVMANALILYDVLSNVVLDAFIGTSKTSEQAMLDLALNQNKFNQSILVTDRNFGCFHFYKRLINSGIKFCIRQKTSNLNFANQVLADERQDFVTEWEPSEKEIKTAKDKGLDASPIKVRVTKIMLSSDVVELLISNLFEDTITQKDLGELYNLRWRIEEAYKQLKPRQKLEQFGCRRSEGIYQEYFAHLVMMNITTLVASLAEQTIKQKTAHRKNKYVYNKTNAWKFTKEILTKLMKYEIIEVLNLLVHQIINSLVRIKPGRSEPRTCSLNRKNRRSPNYK